MDFELTAEESLVRSTAREFLASRADLRRTRTLLGGGDEAEEAALWSDLADRVELCGIAIPAEFGGGDGSPVHLALVLEEMGRVLLSSPYYATVGLAGQTLLAAGSDEARARYLPQIARAAVRATVAFGESAERVGPESISAIATHGDGGWTLRGGCRFVVDGARADVLLVLARTDAGLGLFALDGPMVGVSRCTPDVLDPTRRLGHVEFHDAPAAMVSPEGDATSRLGRALALAQVAAAAEQLGAAQACLDMSVLHATTRTQFGRPIATFQAIKHKCADMLLDIEAARVLVHYAAWAADGAPEQLVEAARRARSTAAAALSRAAARNIQIHGGIGYTWEHDAHLFFRRAKAAKVL